MLWQALMCAIVQRVLSSDTPGNKDRTHTWCWNGVRLLPKVAALRPFLWGLGMVQKGSRGARMMQVSSLYADNVLADLISRGGGGFLQLWFAGTGTDHA